MKHFGLRLRFPSGSPLIGGHSGYQPGVHRAHAMRSSDGAPYIPATALRGALRESLEALLRGTGKPACSGGDGKHPDAPGTADNAADPESHKCILDNGQPCTACRVFGSQGHDDDQDTRANRSVVLHDAHLLRPETASTTTRTSVSLSRATRSAADQHLFVQRMPATAPGRDALEFQASGWLRDPALEPLVQAAVRATTHIGSSRSRGMGHVEITWLDQPASATPGATPAPAPASASATNAIQVRITLESPTLIGAPIVDENMRDTRLEIPGSTLRGAVGFALAGLLHDATRADLDQQSLDTLLHPDHGAHFGFFYPTGDHPGEPGPLPITTSACKSKGRDHPLVDSLVRRLLAILIADLEPDQAIECARRLHQHFPVHCPECEGPLCSPHGTRTRREPPGRHTITRVSLDRARGSARDGQLFTQNRLDAGTEFAGTIRCIPDTSRDHLARALMNPTLSLGRGRSHGWGRVRVTVEPAPERQPIEKRARAFEDTLQRAMKRLGMPDQTRARRLVPVTLLSPLALPHEGSAHHPSDHAAEELAYALDAERCILMARRFVRDGAWDREKNLEQPFWTVCAGSVYVLELRGHVHGRSALERLAELERAGVGERRHQGFGHVICFDPHFTEYAIAKE